MFFSPNQHEKINVYSGVVRAGQHKNTNHYYFSQQSEHDTIFVVVVVLFSTEEITRPACILILLPSVLVYFLTASVIGKPDFPESDKIVTVSA